MQCKHLFKGEMNGARVTIRSALLAISSWLGGFDLLAEKIAALGLPNTNTAGESTWIINYRGAYRTVAIA